METKKKGQKITQFNEFRLNLLFVWTFFSTLLRSLLVSIPFCQLLSPKSCRFVFNETKKEVKKHDDIMFQIKQRRNKKNTIKQETEKQWPNGILIDR